MTRYLTAEVLVGISTFACRTLPVLVLFLIATAPELSARERSETIDATAMGTGAQMVAMIGVTSNIYEFSTPADKALLVQAFQKGRNQGLFNALTRMKAVGHVEITGTPGYDCSFIKMTPTPTGRRIFFITNRLLRFGEVRAARSAWNGVAGPQPKSVCGFAVELRAVAGVQRFLGPGAIDEFSALSGSQRVEFREAPAMGAYDCWRCLAFEGGQRRRLDRGAVSTRIKQPRFPREQNRPGQASRRAGVSGFSGTAGQNL